MIKWCDVQESHFLIFISNLSCRSRKLGGKVTYQITTPAAKLAIDKHSWEDRPKYFCEFYKCFHFF